MFALLAWPCAAQAPWKPEPAPRPISGAEAIGAIKQAMRARGLAPPAGSGLTLDDYIQTGTSQVAPELNERGTRHVGVWVGPEGHMIPDSDWQAMHPTYCKQQARYMLSAAKLFSFKLIRISPPVYYYAFPQFIDVGSQVIDEQRSAEGDDLAGTLADGWAQMQTPIGAPVGPCGKVRVQHLRGTRVGETFEFFAGFKGSYGRYLDYTWDFGDGSAPVSLSQRARHVYSQKGTYVVTVQVDGEHMRPATGSVTVEPGGGLSLHFSSTISQTGAQGYHQMSRFEASVPLEPAGDWTWTGSAPIRNVEYVNTVLARMPGNCETIKREGVMHVRVKLPPREPGSAAGIEVFLQPFSDAETPAVDVVCSVRGMTMPSLGGTWWPMFVVLHRQPGDTMFEFGEWQPSTDRGVIATAQTSNSRAGGPSTISAETTLEIRGAPAQ